MKNRKDACLGLFRWPLLKRIKKKKKTADKPLLSRRGIRSSIYLCPSTDHSTNRPLQLKNDLTHPNQSSSKDHLTARPFFAKNGLGISSPCSTGSHFIGLPNSPLPSALTSLPAAAEAVVGAVRPCASSSRVRPFTLLGDWKPWEGFELGLAAASRVRLPAVADLGRPLLVVALEGGAGALRDGVRILPSRVVGG